MQSIVFYNRNALVLVLIFVVVVLFGVNFDERGRGGDIVIPNQNQNPFLFQYRGRY